ncbi:protein kinase domain-containing protein [Paenibacillus psychroresistens]|nr:protein kinase [Paenibacillus psychroresistens]
MTTSFDANLTTGTMVKGKWNENLYRVERSLGEGENGKVYLVKKGSAFFAMKLGFDPVDHQSEVNVLKQLTKSDSPFNRFLIDVDDYHSGGKDYPFYVMKYIKGLKITDFVQVKGEKWLGLLGLHLLKKLTYLHANGFVFGDIKMENILVSDYGAVELIDFGGVTQKGRAVKQFTEIYDRGYWGAGTRIADEAYDVFAFAILFMQLSDHAHDWFSRHLLPQNRTLDLLKEKLQQEPNNELQVYVPFLRKALDGEFTSSIQAYAAWKALFYKRGKPFPSKPVKGNTLVWIQAGFIASVVLFISVWYFYS